MTKTYRLSDRWAALATWSVAPSRVIRCKPEDLIYSVMAYASYHRIPEHRVQVHIEEIPSETL